MNSTSALRTLLLVGLVAVGAALIVTASHELSKDRIAANQRARLLAALTSVLAPPLRRRDLTTTQLSVVDRELLGSAQPTDVFVAMDNGKPVAAVFASVAPNGYNAPIRLLIGVSPDGTVTGVRAVSHRETPGLGDAIEISKSDWITQFDATTLQMPLPPLWAVDKDDGSFDSITGATVTARAVTAAVKGTLLYFETHGEELFAEALRSLRSNDESAE
jgi:electron transport complex protein RnfG